MLSPSASSSRRTAAPMASRYSAVASRGGGRIVCSSASAAVLRLLDPLRALRQTQRDELPAELLELPAARRLLRQLAQGRDRDGRPDDRALADGPALLVERSPGRPGPE